MANLVFILLYFTVNPSAANCCCNIFHIAKKSFISSIAHRRPKGLSTRHKSPDSGFPVLSSISFSKVHSILKVVLSSLSERTWTFIKTENGMRMGKGKNHTASPGWSGMDTIHQVPSHHTGPFGEYKWQLHRAVVKHLSTTSVVVQYSQLLILHEGLWGLSDTVSWLGLNQVLCFPCPWFVSSQILAN